MTENNPPSSSRSSREQAMDWFVHLQSSQATASDRSRLEAWLNADPVHRQEYEQLTSVWEEFDRIKPMMAKERGQRRTVLSAPESARPSRGFSWGYATAMGVAVMAVACTIWWGTKLPIAEQVYQTAKGEQQTIHLVDGSTIVMNTDSKLSIQISDRARIVTLQQGEALFTVMHDERRPFDVHAANGIIHDIGTEFLIHQSLERVQVAVLEGSVEVGLKNTRKSRSPPKPRILRQGDQVFYTATGSVSPVESFDKETMIAWTEATLFFEAKPLEEVLQEWARYRTGEIRVGDSSLRRIPVSGKFRMDNIQSFFLALEEALSIKARHITPQLVILERKPNT